MSLWSCVHAHPYLFARNVLLLGRNILDSNTTTYLTARDIDHAIRLEDAQAGNTRGIPTVAVLFNPYSRMILFELSGKPHADFARSLDLLNLNTHKLKRGWLGARLCIERESKRVNIIAPSSGTNPTVPDYGKNLYPKNLRALLLMLRDRAAPGIIDWETILNHPEKGLVNAYPPFAAKFMIPPVMAELRSQLT